MILGFGSPEKSPMISLCEFIVVYVRETGVREIYLVGVIWYFTEDDGASCVVGANLGPTLGHLHVWRFCGRNNHQKPLHVGAFENRFIGEWIFKEEDMSRHISNYLLELKYRLHNS